MESSYQRLAELKNGNDPTNFFHVPAARSDGERLDLFLDLLSDAIVLHV
jgi:Berberine and berberine like